MPAKAANDVTQLSANTEARLAISVERTISIQQYEPIKVFGSVSFGADTPPEQIELLLGKFDEYGNQVAEKVIALSEARASELRGSAVAPSPAPRRAAAPRQAAARQPGETVFIQGHEFEGYNNKDGSPALKSTCSVCGSPAYFNAYNNKRTGALVSPQQSAENMLKYDGAIFCRDHKPAKGAAPAARPQYQPRQAPAVPVAEDDDLPF